MNNAVYYDGKIVGYRCYSCNKVVQSMWDTTCNECRMKLQMHRETIKALTGENIQYSPSVTTAGDLPLTATSPIKTAIMQTLTTGQKIVNMIIEKWPGLDLKSAEPSQLAEDIDQFLAEIKLKSTS